jgi:hypothetical protein
MPVVMAIEWCSRKPSIANVPLDLEKHGEIAKIGRLLDIRLFLLRPATNSKPCGSASDIQVHVRLRTFLVSSVEKRTPTPRQNSTRRMV